MWALLSLPSLNVLCTVFRPPSQFVLFTYQGFLFDLGPTRGLYLVWGCWQVGATSAILSQVLRFSNRIFPSTFLGNSRPLLPDLVLCHLVGQTLRLFSLGHDNLALHHLGRPVLEALLLEVSRFGHSDVSSSVVGLTDEAGPIGACHCRLPCLRIVISFHWNGSLLGVFFFLFSFGLV